jgi:dTDP-4-amino-4,6-dideoxygalactose transaminase
VSHTAVATVAAIEAAGASPVLVDVDPTTFTINIQQLEGVLSDKTKAIIVVHLYGQSADLDLIKVFCSKNNLWLIEDVSQAHGATWKGNRLGSIGDIACFSCYPTKNLGALGDAGLITTNNVELARKVRMIREYGWANRYVSDLVGRNSRLDEIQAALLRVKLRYLDSDNNKRKVIAAQYEQGLNLLPIVLPIINPNCESVYHLYVIKTKFRDSLKEYLAKKDIETIIHYPLPVHLQSAYMNRVRTSGNLEVTENLSSEILSLPMYPELDLASVTRVISEVKNFYEWQSK